MLKTRFKRSCWIFGSVIIWVPLFVTLSSYDAVYDRTRSDINSLLKGSLDGPLKNDSGKSDNMVTFTSGTERPKAVQQICSTLKDSNVLNNFHFRGEFYKKRSVYYCNIPKCGSTFMHLFLPKALDCDAACKENVKKDSTQLHVLDDAYSFMFVREPYARLFSAFENKMFLPNEFWKTIGTLIIRTVRPNPSRQSLEIGHDVTFQEVVQHVLKYHEEGHPLNEHFKPMFEHCNPCETKFNFIGQLESMSKDLADLADDMKLTGIVSKNSSTAIKLEADVSYQRAFGPYGHMFTILRLHGRALSRYKLFLRAWSSYHIRGLILKKFEMPFQENEVFNVDEEKYGAEIKKAIDKSMEYKEELKSQRREALIQAYRSVPMDLMMKLRNFMKTDCKLFGYDDMPEFLFNRSDSSLIYDHNYFKGL